MGVFCGFRRALVTWQQEVYRETALCRRIGLYGLGLSDGIYGISTQINTLGDKWHFLANDPHNQEQKQGVENP